MHSRHLSTKLQDKINKLHCKIFTKKIKTIHSWLLMHLPKIYKRFFKGCHCKQKAQRYPGVNSQSLPFSYQKHTDV